jgi:hypothetical protein
MQGAFGFLRPEEDTKGFTLGLSGFLWPEEDTGVYRFLSPARRTQGFPDF